MNNTICNVPGISVGHAHDLKAGTGCTVIIPEKESVCGLHVSGGAPGTRETDALHSVNLVQQVNALYLGGGSAYGLAGAEGVMRWCEENNRGFNVGVGIVPIVPGAVIFDLGFSDYKTRPDLQMGYQACLNASSDECRIGNVGAGAGATIGKGRAVEGQMKGGLGMSSCRIGDIIISALVVVNCFGDIIDYKTGRIIAGTRSESGDSFKGTNEYLKEAIVNGINPLYSNTTLGVIATNVRLTKTEATKISMMTHDGYARVINPIHTMHDGDAIFTLSMGDLEADLSTVGAIAADVMSDAIIAGVNAAETLRGVPGLAG